MIVTVDSGHLFNQILFNRNIVSPGWRARLPAVVSLCSVDTEPIQNIDYLVVCNHNPEKPVEPGALHRHFFKTALMSIVMSVENRAHFAADNIDQQLSGTLHTESLQLTVYSALETLGRICIGIVASWQTGNTCLLYTSPSPRDS